MLKDLLLCHISLCHNFVLEPNDTVYVNDGIFTKAELEEICSHNARSARRSPKVYDDLRQDEMAFGEWNEVTEDAKGHLSQLAAEADWSKRTLRRLLTIGFVHGGRHRTLLQLDCPEGFICRLRQGRFTTLLSVWRPMRPKRCPCW